MQIILKGTDMKIENGQLIIKISSDMERVLGINNVQLSTLKQGDVFTDKNGIKYIVCEQFENGETAICRKDALNRKMEFGSNNNWKESNWREYLNGEYLKELKSGFGAENIVEHETDLLSLDGYDDYGVILDKVSIMNIDRFRKYHKYIGNVDILTWLSTPESTPSGCGTSGVQCVGSGGRVGCRGCYWLDCGVRPFFFLKSSIFVSLVK